jgi:hypothetical protein
MCEFQERWSRAIYFQCRKADERQMEFTDMQCDFKQKFCEVRVPNFYYLIPRDRFPIIVEFAY